MMAAGKARFYIPLGIFLVMGVFLAAGLTLNPRLVPSPLIDKPVPEFSLPRLFQPNDTFVPADLKGKVWVLNVWASWCVACRQEHAVITRLAASNLAPVVGLNYKDVVSDALRWLDQFGNPYTLSAVDADGEVGIDWGVYGVPETFVIDVDGVIRYKHIGPVSDEDADGVILPLIRELRQGST